MQFDQLDFSRIYDLLLKNQVTCVQLIKYYLKKINEGENLNAFIAVFGEDSISRAHQIDRKLRTSKAGKLAGLVIGIKDNINFQGHKTTCCSKILSNYISPYNATVLKRLEAEDAIIIGKTNMDEFAMGSSNENSYWGPVRNPYDLTKVPGGSSGGSAAAVAASLAMAGLGSDTGGSIRQPASFCGVVGLKPTYGRVSRYGLVAFASSLDQIGPIARSVEDCARITEVISGYDPNDSTSAKVAVPEFSRLLCFPLKGIKVGLPVEFFHGGLAGEVKNNVLKTVKLLEAEGAEIKWVNLPHTEYAIAAYYIIANAEASSNLARYDGARYGRRSDSAVDLESMYVQSRSEGFGEEVKRRIMLGTYVLSAGYYEAYYEKAQKVRTLIKKDFEQAFQQCDCLITPTTPTTAFRLGEKIDNPLLMYLSDVFTVSVNLAGLPALSLPCGKDDQDMPIGLQIISNYFKEDLVLRVGYAIEQSLKRLE